MKCTTHILDEHSRRSRWPFLRELRPAGRCTSSDRICCAACALWFRAEFFRLISFARSTFDLPVIAQHGQHLRQWPDPSLSTGDRRKRENSRYARAARWPHRPSQLPPATAVSSTPPPPKISNTCPLAPTAWAVKQGSNAYGKVDLLTILLYEN